MNTNHALTQKILLVCFWLNISILNNSCTSDEPDFRNSPYVKFAVENQTGITILLYDRVDTPTGVEWFRVKDHPEMTNPPNISFDQDECWDNGSSVSCKPGDPENRIRDSIIISPGEISYHHWKANLYEPNDCCVDVKPVAKGQYTANICAQLYNWPCAERPTKLWYDIACIDVPFPVSDGDTEVHVQFTLEHFPEAKCSNEP